MSLTKPGHKPEHGVSDRHLSELFPVFAEAAPDLLQLGGQQKLLPSPASEGSVHFSKGQDRGSLRFVARDGVAHSLRARLGNVDLDQSAGVKKENQRRSSLTISEASLPRFGKAGLLNPRSVRRGKVTRPRDSSSARRCCSVASGSCDNGTNAATGWPSRNTTIRSPRSA